MLVSILHISTSKKNTKLKVEMRRSRVAKSLTGGKKLFCFDRDSEIRSVICNMSF